MLSRTCETADLKMVAETRVTVSGFKNLVTGRSDVTTGESINYEKGDSVE